MNKRIAGAMLFLSSSLVACGPGPEGSYFSIDAKVDHAGARSITILPKDIIETHGNANGWFKLDKESQVHDNYKDGDCDMQTVGRVVDAAGHPQKISDVKSGEWVHLEGRIRKSYSDCGSNNGPSSDKRPVFERAQELYR